MTDSPNERAHLRNAFLEHLGLQHEILTPLPMDASKRQYFRLPQGLLMDAPPPHENTESFAKISTHLSKCGLSVPRVYEADHTGGFMLIEDFGTLTYRGALSQGTPEHELYREAVNGLIHLHQAPLPDWPSYDFERFLTEANVFTEWYGLPLSDKAKEDFNALWKDAFEQHPSLPKSFVMRDVLVDNLMWLPERKGFKRCGYIDFQDGLVGPIIYDLVSLLEDARRDISPAFAEEMLEGYFKAFPDLDIKVFWASYFLWGAQRSTKILGVFSRLAKRDGKKHYLKHLPRVRRILTRDLQHPTLKNLLEWFKACGGLK